MSFLILPIKTLFFVGYRAILALEVTKWQTTVTSALELPHAKFGIPYNEFKHYLNQYIISTWQDDWCGAVTNKLHSVNPVLGDWQTSYRQCRKDEVVLCRARIGHTHRTHLSSGKILHLSVSIVSLF